MLQPYRTISLYFYLIVATLVLSFAGASSVLFWQENKINERRDRNAAFHVPTIRHAVAFKEAVFEFETVALEHVTGTRLHSGSEHNDSRILWQHGIGLIYEVRRRVESIVALQASFGGPEFARTLDKVGAEVELLATALEAPHEQSDAAAARQVSGVLHAVILSLNQLEKLHAIAFWENNRQIAADIRRRNVIVFPTALVILICGLLGLAYLAGQTRSALVRLAETDRALKDLNQNLENRVEQRTAELQATQDQLVRKERLAAVGQVTGTVSHELRNPLGAIRSGIDAMKKLVQPADSILNRIVDLLDRSERRCDRVIGDLLDFARVRELERQPTRIDEWIGALLNEETLPKHVSLRRQLHSDASLAFDRDRIERALRNVIQNACQAMEADSDLADDHHLTVATRVTEGLLEISVTDTGVGIEPENRAKVFEPLFSTKSYGVGLGLPMVKQTMEQHGGSIEIREAPGRGTVVVFTLPLTESQQGAAA